METDYCAADVRPTEEEGESSDQDWESVTAEIDWVLSEEQTYRETVRGIRPYIGWSRISISTTHPPQVMTTLLLAKAALHWQHTCELIH